MDRFSEYRIMWVLVFSIYRRQRKRSVKYTPDFGNICCETALRCFSFPFICDIAPAVKMRRYIFFGSKKIYHLSVISVFCVLPINNSAKWNFFPASVCSKRNRPCNNWNCSKKKKGLFLSYKPFEQVHFFILISPLLY